MSPRTTEVRAPRPRRWVGARPPVAGGLLVVLGAALVLAVTTVGVPGRVERLEVVNGTRYELFVEVHGDRPGWTPVAVVAPGHDVTLLSVLDQGELWTFRFSGQGADGGTMMYPRAELAGAGWRLDVGRTVDDRLAAAGAPPSPVR